MAILSAFEVADYFLTSVDAESGDNIPNLKLQKLLYYGQGFHLAILGAPLFDEAIVAWEHGPVVPSVYDRYRQHGANALPPPDAVDFGKYPAESREVLDEVFSAYGQFSAWKLRDMTRDEAPWKRTPRNGTIDTGLMRDYFKTCLTHG